MNKMPEETKNLSEEKIEKLAALFPNCLTETIGEDGEIKRAIDFDALKNELGNQFTEGRGERYRFTWPGEKNADYVANEASNQILRPLKDKSIDFDKTKNVYIEGDNLEALKILRETYLGKIKVIYIDPPYNTGNDFVYRDDFKVSTEDFLKDGGNIDELGNRLVANSENDGKFHSNWLNMIYPRLKLARDYLSDDGVIFISIDDHEYPNLRKVADSVFGEHNFISTIVWERAYSPVNLMKHFSTSHDYIVIYAKNLELAVCHGLPRGNAANERYINPDNDPRGPWKSSDMSVGPAVEANIYEIKIPSGRSVLPPNGRSWVFSKLRFEEYLKDNRIWFGPMGDSTPSTKRFLSEVKQGITPMTIWKYTEVGHSQDASQYLKKLFDGKAYFDYPKPVGLIQRCIQLYSDKDSIVLDFFSGSGTTGEAIFKQNVLDNGARKFILVQLPEETKKNSQARKDGYLNICDIAEERLKRAGKKIKGESPLTTQDLDVGFRVFKVDSSNMKDLERIPQNTQLSLLENYDFTIKEGRTALDLVVQTMIRLGIPLDSEITRKFAGGGTEYYTVNGNDLVCCFAKDVPEKDIEEFARLQPLNVAFRDESFAKDEDSVNCEQIFKTLSPITGKNVYVL